MSEPRVIKRYANRKLYDTQSSQYVTLDQIAQMIRAGEEVRVLDNNSKDDLTSVTLAQIIFEEEKRQKSFILSAMPPSCAFCMPGGPDAIVEVKAKTPIKYGYEPVVISGRFVVLKDDPTGLFYRLTDAVVVGGK